jgi:Protein of unknown function (DUF1553)/Protein of unknown function (DUF1549)/Planctomycete cytochrome C
MRGAAIAVILSQCAVGQVQFNRDIRPIMSDTCFRCHGPDARARMAGMRLDIREEALKKTASGVTPIVPGSPDQSAVITRIFADSPAKVMPPAYLHKELTAAQKQTIREWVAQGAVYQKHWSYEPVKRPPVPVIPDAKNPIDAFIKERLAREGLAASPEADRRTLLRRVTLDLTGLPPTPAEMAAFQPDQSADAYEKVVDRLLASPRYAEMQAMHWLDAVRYADSAGFHGDNLWPSWPYRDYVLRAFRDNKPFDQFTREQIAGDLIPNATTEQKIASAYNRLNRVSGEGGLQPKEYLAKYGADRVRTLSTVWMASTLGCAECHDHKFDPFTSRDFYSMKAFFADVRETGLVSDRGDQAWGSKLALPTPEQSARMGALNKQIESAEAERKRVAEKMIDQRWEWEDRILAAFQSGALAWRYQRPIRASSVNGAKLTIYNDEPIDFDYYLNGSLHSERKRGDGLVVASGANPDNETYVIALRPGAGEWTALGIDVHQDESLPGNRMARGADRFVLTEVEAEVSDGRKIALVLATSTGFGETGAYPAMAAIDGDAKTGWAVGYGEARNPFLAVRFASKVKTTADSVITVRLHHDSDLRRATIGRFRIALSGFENSWPENGEASRKSAEGSKTDAALLNIPVDRGLRSDVLAALEKHEDDRNAAEKALVLNHFMWAAPEMQSLTVRIEKLRMERAMLDSSIVRVMYTERSKPRVTRILARANWMDDTGAIVEPAVPRFLDALDTGGRRATRLDLANWLVSRDNPLTARAFVNRQWREFFGTGLSKTLEDLGSQGEWPTHPELLDWLAAEFMRPSSPRAHAWDVKNLIRTMVTSHTYRQSSDSRPELEERDPDNRLLARQSRFRVEAEIVHDIAFSVSDLLVERFGGPSVRPYQPDGYLAAVNFPKREYAASHGDDLYRRALYTQWQRTFLHPSLLTFDAPTREECGVNRVSSNTPLQALELLNDPVFLEAARAFAANILRSGEGLDRELNWAFLKALNRTATGEELVVLRGLHQRSLVSFESGESNAKEFLAVGDAAAPAELNREKLAAMMTVARAILNLHETITRN